MHCQDYQAEPMRSCCATTIGELHAPDCNRRVERRMIAGAEARVRIGRDLRPHKLDWRPADRMVGAITMWDAPDDPAATVAIDEELAEEELVLEFEPDPELDAFVARMRRLGWMVLLLPIGACGAFQGGAYVAAHFTPDRTPAAAWGQLATIVVGVIGLAAIAHALLGDDSARAHHTA